MPSRLIRDGLLDSQRYWSVSIEARQLFVHLMLLADDFGLVGLAPVFLRRRCFDNPPPDSKIGKQVAELHDEDLLRVYEVNGARFGFIPRFGQRMRQARARHPMPPEALFSDDLDAEKLFTENKKLFEKLSAGRGRTGDNLRPEVEVEGKGKEKEVEAKGEGEAGKGAPAAGQTGPQTERRTPAQQETPKGVPERAKELGLHRQSGEPEGAFQARVGLAWQQHKASAAA